MHYATIGISTNNLPTEAFTSIICASIIVSAFNVFVLHIRKVDVGRIHTAITAEL